MGQLKSIYYDSVCCANWVIQDSAKQYRDVDCGPIDETGSLITAMFHVRNFELANRIRELLKLAGMG